jgi:hypothetical protein
VCTVASAGVNCAISHTVQSAGRCGGGPADLSRVDGFGAAESVQAHGFSAFGVPGAERRQRGLQDALVTPVPGLVR